MNREIETRDKIFSTTNSLQQLLGPCQDLTRNSCARGFAVLVFGNHIFFVWLMFFRMITKERLLLVWNALSTGFTRAPFLRHFCEVNADVHYSRIKFQLLSDNSRRRGLCSQ